MRRTKGILNNRCFREPFFEKDNLSARNAEEYEYAEKAGRDDAFSFSFPALLFTFAACFEAKALSFYGSPAPIFLSYD